MLICPMLICPTQPCRWTIVPNHPNRNRSHPARTPAPDEVRAARVAAGLTQRQAADLIYGSLRTWQEWEWGERRMHPAMWRLFRILVRNGTNEKSR